MFRTRTARTAPLSALRRVRSFAERSALVAQEPAQHAAMPVVPVVPCASATAGAPGVAATDAPDPVSLLSAEPATATAEPTIKRPYVAAPNARTAAYIAGGSWAPLLSAEPAPHGGIALGSLLGSKGWAVSLLSADRSLAVARREIGDRRFAYSVWAIDGAPRFVAHYGERSDRALSAFLARS